MTPAAHAAFARTHAAPGADRLAYAWDISMGLPERRLLLRVSKLPEYRVHCAWGALDDDARARIRQAAACLQRWADLLAETTA